MNLARFARTVVVLLLASLSVIAFSPAALARAGSWTVDTCHRFDAAEQASGQEWFGYFASYSVSFNRCPDPGLTLSLDDPRIAPGQYVTWQYSWPADRVKPAAVKMRLHGGDTSHGVVYGVSDGPGMPPYFDFGPRGPDDDLIADPEITVDVGPATGGIFITANCVEFGCTADRDLFVNDIQVVYEDDAPPTLTLTPLLHPNAFDGSGSAWLRPMPEPAVIDAGDAGAGTAYASATLDDDHTPFWSAASGCTDDRYTDSNWSERCGAALGFTGLIDLTDLADGAHKVTLRGTDGAHNAAAPVVLPFLIDGTPPEPISGLEVDPDLTGGATSGDGWTSAPTAAVRWSPPPPDGGAPITKVHYRLEPVPREATMPPTVTVEPGDAGLVRFPHEGEFRVAAWAEDAAGNVGDKEYRSIGFDADAPAPPALVSLGWRSAADLRAGLVQTWASPSPDAALNAGRCGYSADVTRIRDGDPGHTVTIPGAATSWSIPGPLADGRHYVHVRAISCAGETSDVAVATVDVDTVPPMAWLTGVPATTWSRIPLTVQIAGADERSGLAQLRWSLDGGPQQQALASPSVDISEGEHRLRYWAVDAAGNASAPEERTLRVDRTAPTSVIEARDAQRPGQLRAIVRDPLSGVARAALEIRARDVDGAAWQPISAVVEPAVGTSEVEVVGDLPDGTAAPGAYDVRVDAADAAGNETSSGLAPLAERATVLLPARAPVMLQVAIGRTRGKRGTIDASAAGGSRVLPWAERPAAVGSITTADGQALSGAAVTLEIRGADGRAERHDVRAGADGRFALALPRGPSRAITAQFAGTDLLAPATASATLAVRAGVSLRLSRTTVRSRTRITFSGQIEGAGVVETAGKIVLIQWARGHRWFNTFGALRANASGRFEVGWTSPKVSRRGRLEFRAFVPKDGAWPFEDGGSAPRYLTVAP